MEESQRPQAAAERLLKLLASEGQPLTGATPLDALAERLGVDVLLFNVETQRPGVLGWLEPGENVIYLRAGLPEPARRFTLAHELGHHVLHRSASLSALAAPTPSEDLETEGALSAIEDCDDRDLDAPLDALSAADETLRPGQAYSARASRESEANIFAAALLLPPAKLLAAYRASLDADGAPRKRDRLRSLAERFVVSEDVLLRQLTALLTPAVRGAGAAEADTSPATRSDTTLDPWQRAAAESGAPALVVAGPGTGKTSTLVARVRHLILERGVAPQRILALTFSNKAAREMRERLDHLLLPSHSDASGREALPTVSTIHAFCGDLLRAYAPRAGLRPDFRLVSETDGYFLLRELANTLRLAHYQPLAAPALHFPALLAAISRAKDELCEPETYAAAAARMLQVAQTPEERIAGERAAEVAEIYAAYSAALAARGDADFGDMIRLAVRVLCEHPDVLAEVRARHHHILVDEFQDINRAMGVLLRTLAGESGPLWAVGDADQAIYRFRGASPANLSRFAVEYPAAQVHTLRQNYRSRPTILEAAAALAGAYLGGEERGSEPLRSVRGGEGAVTRASAPDERAELAGLVEAIRSRHEEGRPLREQVVLCRTRRHCQRVAAALSSAGMETRLAVPMLEQPDVKNILSVVSLLVDSSGMGLLRAGNLPDHAFSASEGRAVLTAARERQVTPGTFLNLLPAEEVPGISPESLAGLVSLREALAELRTVPTVAQGMARYVFGLTGLGERLLGSGGAETRPGAAGAVAQVLALARAFDDRAEPQHGGRRADWAGFLDYVRVVAALHQEAGGGADELAGDTRDGVRVLTVHASKGLEFPVVYLPGLVNRRFPIQRRGTSAPLPALDGDEGSEEAASHLTEEACLFYVALTRARDELVLSHADVYGHMRYQPSPFLAPLDVRLGSRLRHEYWSGPAPVSAPDREESDASMEEAPAPSEAPVPISAIETFSRCPRQYAYRYLYHLRTREVGLATLRHALHDTLEALHVRLATPNAEQDNEAEAVSLEEAQALFEERWLAALERERGGPPSGNLVPVSVNESVSYQLAPNPFLSMYRRHGSAVVERMWRQMAEPRTNATPPRTRFDADVTVHVGGQDVAVTLDRVEHGIVAGAGSRRRSGATAPTPRDHADEAPVRIVRHRIGRAEMEQVDLRTLLYELAAQQVASPARPELQQHNLTTGEVGTVRLDGRKLTRLRERLDDLLAGMRGGAYPPKPDPMVCPNCPFFLICPA